MRSELPWVQVVLFFYAESVVAKTFPVGNTRVRDRRSSRLSLPVVAVGSIPHIYRREGRSPGDPKDVAPLRGRT